MRMRLTALILLVVAGATVWAQDDERTMLRYTWTAGDTIVWNVISETTGTVVMRDLTKDPVEETEVPMWSRMTMPMRLSVEEVDGRGNATVVYEFGVIQIDAEAQGVLQYVEIDPNERTMTANGVPVPLPEAMLSAMGEPFRMVISPRGEVLEMEMPENLSAMMGGSGMDIEQWMKMSQGWTANFPEEAIGVDHVWGGSMRPPLTGGDEAEAAPAGEMTVLYRLLGTRRDGAAEVAQLEMLGVMAFETMPMSGAQMMTGMAGGEGLETSIGPVHASISGTLDFNVDAGELVASEMAVVMNMTQHVRGTVRTPDGEQQVNMEIITRDLRVDAMVEVGQ